MEPNEYTAQDVRNMEIPDAEFARYVRLTDFSDNRDDDRRRAVMMGFTGENIRIAPGAIVRIPTEQVGAGTFIGLYSYLNGNVTVGEHVLIGPHCSVVAGHHKFDPQTGWFSARTENDGCNAVIIGDGCWLASNVTVTAGVRLGRATLVCAGAVVTHSFGDYAILAGLPARQIGRIDPDTGEYIWFRGNRETD